MLAYVALSTDHRLWWHVMQFEQLLDLLLDLRRAYLTDLWELLHDEMLEILASPDAVLFGEEVNDKCLVDAIGDAQEDCLVPMQGDRAYLVD